MRREPSEVPHRQVVEEVALQAVRPAGVIYVEPPPYELEYLYVPDFMANQEPTTVPVKEKEPLTPEVAVASIKHVRQPLGYEVEFPYAQDLTSLKPHVKALEREKTHLDVSKPEVARYAEVQPPSYELEYRYIPDFMTRETSETAIRQVPQEGALQAVRPAGVLYVEPPSYELEYVYVPEFMAREDPTTVPLRKKEPVTLEAAVPSTEQGKPPPGYEVELPCAPDLTTSTPHEDAPKKEKVEKAEALEFEAPQHTEVAHRQAAEEGALQAVRPAGVLYVEPPSYELVYLYVPEFMAREEPASVPKWPIVRPLEEGALQAVRPAGVLYVEPPSYELVYLYVPEFMSREEPTSVPVREKEPVTHEVAVTAIKQARQPPGYEVEFPYAPDLTYKKPHVEALERDKTQPLQVSKPELAEHVKSLQAVRPPGVLYVEPPSYELEYLYVPEFMATQTTTSVPEKGKETMGMEAAVPTVPQVTSHAGYEVDFPNAPDIISRRPHVEPPVKEGTEKTEVFKFEVPEHAKVHASSHEMEYKYTRRIMTHGNLSSVVVQRNVVKEGALQAVRPAGVLYVEPPSYELEYVYVPDFMAREGPTTVPLKEKEPITLEAAVPLSQQERPPPGYEVELPYAKDLTTWIPHEEAPKMEKVEKAPSFRV
ncbi:hypothetical protein MTO96_009279 [Rhipicephalus appendiculatus]